MTSLLRSALLSSVPSLFLAGSLAAQLAAGGRPFSERTALPREVPVIVLPQPDVASLRAEDEARGQRPYRYGAVLATSISPEEQGRWDEAEGRLVWRVELRSPGALSLGLVLDDFELPAGAELFVHDPALTQVLGAYTAANDGPHRSLAIQPLRGDALVLEYSQPKALAGAPRLRVGQVIHDYRGILTALAAGSIQASSCLIDINCPIGAGYQDIKRSVIMVISGGALCSAGLLNNTAQDGTPYFLTADHCGDMTNVVAIFNYELPGCGTGMASQSQTLSGATLLAASSLYDSQLYLLDQTPPPSFAPFFAGWNRAKNVPAPGISISHPSGLPKKLARDDDQPYASGNFWTVQWEIGTLEPGSSGSPLFDGQKRVLGPTCCVSNFTCNNQLTNYGRLGPFWNARGLDLYLDPLGLGVTAIDGFDEFAPSAAVYNGSGANPVLLASTTPPRLGTTWQVTVDTSGAPAATLSYLQGRAGQSSGLFFPFGELLIDLSSSFVFAHFAPVAAGSSLHSIPLPLSPAFAGLVAYVQAGILGPQPAVATNGLRVQVY